MIDLTSVFSYIMQALTLIYTFMQNILVFRIGDYTFNMLQFALGAVSFRFAINTVFGSPEEEEVTFYED